MTILCFTNACQESTQKKTSYQNQVKGEEAKLYIIQEANMVLKRASKNTFENVTIIFPHIKAVEKLVVPR